LGEEDGDTLLSANNYATSLVILERFEEAKSLLRRTTPVARRVLGESHDLALTMRWLYAAALSNDPGATLDELRDAVERFGRRDGRDVERPQSRRPILRTCIIG